MKKVKTLFSPRKLLIWLLIVLAIFTLPEVSKPAMSQTEAIVTLMCLDMKDDEIVASVSVLTPGVEKYTNYEYYSSSGENLSQTIDKISLMIGKEMGFSQCELIAFGKTISEKGVLDALDYMTRTKKISRNARLVTFSGDIQDLSLALKGLSDKKQLKVENILNFDNRYISSKDSNVNTFYKGYLGYAAMDLMPIIAVSKDEINNAIVIEANSSSTKNSGNSSGSSSGSQNLYLQIDGSAAVYKDGKISLIISSENVRKINLVNNQTYSGTITVKNINDDLYKDAQVVFSVSKSKTKTFVDFDGDKPVFTLQPSLTVYIEQVKQDEVSKDFMTRSKNFLTESVILALKEKVGTDLKDLITYCKENNIDVFNVYDKFDKFRHKKFANYLTTTNKDDYLQNIDFKIDVKIFSTY